MADRFDARGIALIFITFCMYFTYAGWAFDGMNIFVPWLAKEKGWSAATLLNYVGLGSIFSVIGSVLFGQLVIKYGAKRVLMLCMLGAIPSIYLFGHLDAIWQFALALIAINIFGTGLSLIAPGSLLVSWFPKRKGVALALATAGFPAATAGFVPLADYAISAYGLRGLAQLWCVLLVLLMVLAWFWVQDRRPGTEAAEANEADAVTSTIPISQSLRDPMVWKIGIGWGALWLVTAGIVVQLVPRLVEIGYQQNEAIGLLSAAALIAIPGGLIWGFLDLKFGTRQASLVYGPLYIFTLCLLIFATKSPWLIALAVLLVGMGLGGIKSLLTSIVASVYGQEGFAAAYRVVMPITIIMRSLAFPIMGFAIDRFGTLAAAYVVFIGINIIATAFVLSTPKAVR